MSKRKAKHAGLTVVKRRGDVVSRVVAILEQARAQVVRTVNSAQVVANWLVGREIVEAEHAGKRSAGYGERLLVELSGALNERYGRGYSATNLR